MDKKKKKLIIIVTIALVAVCIMCYSLYISTPKISLIPEGATIDKITITYNEIKRNSDEEIKIEFTPKEVSQLSVLLRSVKGYPINPFAYKDYLYEGEDENYIIHFKIDVTLDKGYEGTKNYNKKVGRYMNIDRNYISSINERKQLVIHPFVTKAQHLEFYNQLLEYKDNPFGTVIEEEN